MKVKVVSAKKRVEKVCRFSITGTKVRDVMKKGIKDVNEIYKNLFSYFNHRHIREWNAFIIISFWVSFWKRRGY